MKHMIGAAVVSSSLLVAASVGAQGPDAGKAGAAGKAAAAPAAAAAPGGAPPAPKPAAELEQMKMFVGSWKCEGKGFASPFSPAEHPIKASAKVKADAKGFWQTFVYEEKKTKEHPMAAKVYGTWGWDSAGKRFVRADYDEMGGWFAPTSAGWQGDQFVWTGDFASGMGQKFPARHTFTKKGDKEFVHALELSIAGKPTPMFEVTCKK